MKLRSARASFALAALVVIPAAGAGNANRAVAERVGSWSAPTVVGPVISGQTVRLPVVVRDGHGNGAALWEILDSSSGGYLGATADFRAGGGWAAPTALDGGIAAQLASDARGDLLAVWTDLAGTVQRIRAAFRPAGGAWRTPVYVSRADEVASIPHVAMDASGRALVVWTAYPSAGGYPKLASVKSASRSAGGRWSQPLTVARVSAYPDPQLAMDTRGRALVVWEGETGLIRVASRAPGGSWTPSATLSPPNDQGVRDPRVALNDNGEAVVVWMGAPAGQATLMLEASIRPAGGRFGSVREIAGEVTGVSNVALAADGEAVVLSSDGDVVYANARVPGGRFGRPQLLSNAAFAPAVGIDARGNALALWTRTNGTDLFIDAATRTAGHRFGAGADLAPVGPDCFKHRCLVGGEKALAVSPRGAAIAVWTVQPDPQRGVGSYVEASQYTQP